MGLGEMFGGEKHTKETYRDASRDLVEKERLEESAFSGPPILYPVLMKNAEKARLKIEKLYGKGRAEAIALNEEYDRLMASTLEAVKTLQEFEKNKLGMS